MPRHGDARRLLAGVRAGEQGDRHRGSFFRRADDPVGPYLLSLVPPDSPTFRSRNTQYLPGLLDDTSLSSPLRCSHLILLPVRLSFLLFSSSLPSLSVARASRLGGSLGRAHYTHIRAHTRARAARRSLTPCVSYSLSLFVPSSSPPPPISLALPFTPSFSPSHARTLLLLLLLLVAVLLLYFFSFRLSSTSSSSSPPAEISRRLSAPLSTT